jgi:predicted AAA+ superfamily ATPase
MNILKTLYSCYATDLLLRNSWINKDETYNYGKQLENIVFFELKRRFNKVNIGYASNVSNGERKSLQIDFFCQNRVGKFYFQVCENITNEETLNREINALKKVKDGRKILLNNSGVNKNIDEIEIIDIKKWLLDIP